MKETCEEIARSHRELDVHERDDHVIVVGYWDDLSPEPRRTHVTDQLHEFRRGVWNTAYEVSDVYQRCGQAHVRVYPQS